MTCTLCWSTVDVVLLTRSSRLSRSDVNAAQRLRLCAFPASASSYTSTQQQTRTLVHHFHSFLYRNVSLSHTFPPLPTPTSCASRHLANLSPSVFRSPTASMMASPLHPPQLVASGSTYSPLDSPYSSFSSPRYEHPASSGPSSSSSIAYASFHRPCMYSNGSVYSDISSNEDFDFSDPAPLSSIPSPVLQSAPNLPKTKTPLASAPTCRPLFGQSDSVLSNLSPSETLDFSDPAADAAAASRQALPTPPPAPAARRPITRYSPDGYPFPWVLSRPATPPTLLHATSAFSTPSTSGQNTPNSSAPSPSPFINDVEAQTTTILTSREINSHGSKPLPDTPVAEIPTTPEELVHSRGRYAGSTPGCTGPLPMISHEEDQEEEEEEDGSEITPRRSLRKRNSVNALLAARMLSGMSSAGLTANQPTVASPLREVVE